MESNVSVNSSANLMLISFVLLDTSFGIDADLVQEVVKVGEIRRIHNSPVNILGIRNLRGHIVTVVDLGSLFGIQNAEVTDESRLLIMYNNGETFGFLVDKVTDDITVNKEKIEEPPSNINPKLRKFITGVWREGQNLTAVLKFNSLFAKDLD